MRFGLLTEMTRHCQEEYLVLESLRFRTRESRQVRTLGVRGEAYIPP